MKRSILVLIVLLSGEPTAAMATEGPPNVIVVMADDPRPPKRFAPDVRTKRHPVEKDYFLFESPCRSLEQIDAIQAEMVKGTFTPPPNDWQHLERTRRALMDGGTLHIMGLGDSIVNDTMRSGWIARLREAYPKATIQGTVYVRGGGGCQHYKEAGRVEKYILPREPDLVFIGGISQKDMESIRAVIHQLRAGLPEVEILLATGTFGRVDPRDADAMAQEQAKGEGLRKLASDERCAFLDMRTAWAEYIRSTRVDPGEFYRDPVHANAFGEQILSRILMAFFRPAAPLPETDR